MIICVINILESGTCEPETACDWPPAAESLVTLQGTVRPNPSMGQPYSTGYQKLYEVEALEIWDTRGYLDTDWPWRPHSQFLNLKIGKDHLT